MEKQYEKTMGTLALKASKCPEFTDDLKTRISAAVKRRNFLAHGYWRTSAMDFMTQEGRAKMISRDADTFEQLEKDIREATKPTRTRLGINEKVLDEKVENRLGEIKKDLKLT